LRNHYEFKKPIEYFEYIDKKTVIFHSIFYYFLNVLEQEKLTYLEQRSNSSKFQNGSSRRVNRNVALTDFSHHIYFLDIGKFTIHESHSFCVKIKSRTPSPLSVDKFQASLEGSSFRFAAESPNYLPENEEVKLHFFSIQQ
jgi:hypothetical protein